MFTAYSQSRLECDTHIHLVILVCASIKSLRRGLQSPINNVSAAITYSIGSLNIDVENDKLTLTARFVRPLSRDALTRTHYAPSL